MRTSSPENPFYLVLLTVVFLGILSLLKPDRSIAGLELKRINLLSDVTRRPPLVRSRTRFAQAPPPQLAATPDTPATQPPAPGKARPIVLPKATAAVTPIENVGGLTSFFQALRATQQTGHKTRIAYFGDSMIEGDLITSDLRSGLQRVFGGAGVGFVPMTSITADFRATIHQSFSDDWQDYSLLNKKIPEAHPVGMSGHVFVPRVVRAAEDDSMPPSSQGSWVQFTAPGRPSELSTFQRVTLLYGPGPGTDAVRVQTGPRQTVQHLTGNGLVNELALAKVAGSKKLRLEFDCFDRRSLYGLRFEGDSGVVLDNFSLRGNSGMPLSRIQRNVLQGFRRTQDYQLIILHYGVNVANHKLTSYSFYEKGMGRVVARLQEAFPQASILLVGMSDKGYNDGGEIVTDPSVPRLLQAQANVAAKYHTAFWSLFDAMGGENSMTTWADAKHPLANKDYTHLNARGARKVADLLLQSLLQSYRQYRPAPAGGGETTEAAPVL